jgi:acetyl esterase/lipase
MVLKMPGTDVETRRIGDATCYVATPVGISDVDRRKAHLSIHGGGWVLFGGRIAMALGKLTASRFGGVTYAVDYRMPPDHPFPAGLNDCFAVYKALLKDYGAKNILVSGGSAGGNLAAALMHKLRDEGLPKPAALVLDTPVTDLTNAGDSWKVLAGLDPVLRDCDGVGSTELYLNGQDPRNPYLSPLFGKHADAFPATHLTTGTRDRLLSDTVRMHAALRAAGVPADLYVAEAMPHSGFGSLTPEDAAVLADTKRWLAGKWPAA